MQCSLSRQRGIQQTLEAAAAKTVVTLSEERKESRSIPPLRNQKKIILGMVRLVAKMASLMYRCMQASGMKDGSRARDHQSCESLAASSSQCATISNEKPQNEKRGLLHCCSIGSIVCLAVAVLDLSILRRPPSASSHGLHLHRFWR